MRQADAIRAIGRLKAAFPTMSLDESQSEVLLQQVVLLHDPSVMAEAVDHLIKTEDRFPSIARIRLAYRSVNEARHTARLALEAAEPSRENEIPEWVHVWEWQRQRTVTERTAANTISKAPFEYRPPVRMRDFPQMSKLADAYTDDEYEEMRAGWEQDGSPRFGSFAGITLP